MADGIMPFFTDPLKYLLAKNLHPPQFEEESVMWPDFVWERENFWAGTTVGLNPSDADKLKNFETCFSKDLQDEINYLKRGGEPIAYTHVFAIFEARFGRKQG